MVSRLIPKAVMARICGQRISRPRFSDTCPSARPENSVAGYGADCESETGEGHGGHNEEEGAYHRLFKLADIETPPESNQRP